MLLVAIAILGQLGSAYRAPHAHAGGVIEISPTSTVGDQRRSSHERLPLGVKSYLVKKAVELIAAAFRRGGDILAYITRWVDDDAARAISKYGDDIADALDDIAAIPNLTTQIVKEKLYYFLNNSLSLSGGTSLQIADAVATTIEWLLL